MNILVVDDHPLTCAGLAMLLRSALPQAQVTGVHDSAGARAWLQDAAEVDWIFLDVRLPDDPDCSLFEWLRATGRMSRVVLMSAESAPGTVQYALAAGARGFIPKSADPDEVLRGFAAIRGGTVYLPQALAGHGGPPPAASGFSPRKEDVYRLLLKGLPNKVIARELGLSEYTVKEYVSAILVSRGVGSRLELILQEAPQRGLLPRDG